MKVAILYDCMFPYTVGGGERWYVSIAERVSGDHEVSYLTLQQWPAEQAPEVPFDVKAVGPKMELYTKGGRRRIWPSLRYGWGVFWHLLRHGGEYDIVHSSAFPYFSVIGAKAALLFHRNTKLAVDWLEVWSKDYWRGYLGRVGGTIGWSIQSVCARLPDHNFAISELHARRLPGAATVNRGLMAAAVDEGRPEAPAPAPDPPHAVFAGRHIPEKNVTVLPAALAKARERLPGITMTIFGDGPEHERLQAEIERTGTASVIDVAGFADGERVHAAFAAASCMVLPSVREGYGMVVIEALALGTPVVVVAGEDNAATEFVVDGVNGFVAASASPDDLSNAIVKAVAGGDRLRSSSFAWYGEHADELSLDGSVERIVAVWEELTT